MGLGNRIVSVVCAICLAVSFVAAGFVAVAVPDNATTSLADAYAGTTNPKTPFSHEELCDMALAGKRYTFDKNDRFALNQAIYDINAQAEADGRAHRGSLDTALWDEMAARDKVSGADAANAASISLFFSLANTFGGSHDEAGDLARMSTLQPSSENVDMLLAQASDTYVLDPEAIEHLDDVFGVLATAEPVVLGAFIAAVLTAVGVGCASGRRTFGTVLLCAGLGTIAIFAILGIWAAIDFEGLFAVFHSLFFAQGSWVFSADSLLITMYPEPFWVGMGAIWLATTIAVSAVSAIAGLALRRA